MQQVTPIVPVLNCRLQFRMLMFAVSCNMVQIQFSCDKKNALIQFVIIESDTTLEIAKNLMKKYLDIITINF